MINLTLYYPYKFAKWEGDKFEQNGENFHADNVYS